MNTKEKIYNYYDEYKKFMRVDKMPLIVPVEKHKTHNMDSFASLDKDFIQGQGIPIIYVDSLLNYDESFIKSIFFHEFTHIYDANIKFINLDKSSLDVVMDSFSEYHASQIEMASQLGMKNKNDIFTLSGKFKTDCKMKYKEEITDIQNYILYSLADITYVLNSQQNSLSNMSDFLFEKQYIETEKRIFYYYGKYDLYIKYSGKNMPDLLLQNCPQFSKEINNIHNFAKSKDIINNIDPMKSAINDFRKAYFEHLK